ncbi:MAG: Gfo/Idh/MocA family oxidoreductase [Trueperaceae bacterium]|nr:Gfo/Idh/MocA family oxidoreductase [Trueperaceae bacterium]
MIREPARPIRLGMVGGGKDAFIGAVHRIAARLDGNFELVAGALSSTPDKARASGEALGLPRVYESWEEMLEAERGLDSDTRIEAVAIVTPNHVHHPVAKAFAEAGIHVICDKPLALNAEQADDLVATAHQAGIVFGVTYNYTGYAMVRQAREMIRDGMLGKLRKVIIEYNQGWLASKLEDEGVKQAEWRTDPERSGMAGAIGDIGSHAENLVSTVTGLELEALCADLTTFVPGRLLDDDGNLLLRFHGGAKGVLIASQVEVGEENDLRLRVYGAEGGLDWRQETPNRLTYLRNDEPARIYTRNGPGLYPAAQELGRVPPGHPEGYLEAFANVYGGIAAAIRGQQDADFPNVRDGARGVRFIEATVASAASNDKWTPFSSETRE